MRLSPNEQKIYALLSDGNWHSTLGVMQICRLSDPRGHISHMREKGVQVLSEWRKVGSGRTLTRFKMYKIIAPKNE